MSDGGHSVSVNDTPDGYDWQVVEMTEVSQSTISYKRVRYGLTFEHAVEKAEENDLWKAVPMPDKIN